MRRRYPTLRKIGPRAPKPISPKWWKAIMAYLQPPYSKAAALRAAGFSEGTALHHANRIFSDARVQRFLALYYREEERKRLESLRDKTPYPEVRSIFDSKLQKLAESATHDRILKV